MKSIIRILILFVPLFFFGNIFAAEMLQQDDFVAGIVNRTGNVIKFFPRNENVAVAITSGSAAHVFWDASPSLPIRFAGLPTGGQYVWICPDIQHINAGETITVFIKDRADEGQDFYCRIEPAVN